MNRLKIKLSNNKITVTKNNGLGSFSTYKTFLEIVFRNTKTFGYLIRLKNDNETIFTNDIATKKSKKYKLRMKRYGIKFEQYGARIIT